MRRIEFPCDLPNADKLMEERKKVKEDKCQALCGRYAGRLLR